jgi:hypothetical protein
MKKRKLENILDEKKTKKTIFANDIVFNIFLLLEGNEIVKG